MHAVRTIAAPMVNAGRFARPPADWNMGYRPRLTPCNEPAWSLLASGVGDGYRLGSEVSASLDLRAGSASRADIRRTERATGPSSRDSTASISRPRRQGDDQLAIRGRGTRPVVADVHLAEPPEASSMLAHEELASGSEGSRQTSSSNQRLVRQRTNCDSLDLPRWMRLDRAQCDYVTAIDRASGPPCHRSNDEARDSGHRLLAPRARARIATFRSPRPKFPSA
jgi:hypothetical protein